jgi:large subunit ribosomal protein L29
LKSSELRGLSVQELNERLEQTTKNLYQMRVRATTKEQENTAAIRDERRNVARIKQAIAEKQQEASANEKAS